jgi:alpha-1,2-mannosyltransferase
VASWVRRDAALILSWLLMLVSIPVMAVLQLGQLGLILAALVLVDVVVVPPKYRGLLTGLAGAIKLIPLIMLPYYLISRQWRTASMTALGFGGATLIGLWALPGESVKYWTQYAWSTGRFPGIGTERNVSLLGLLQFAQVPGATVWWVVTAAVVMGLGLWGAVRLYGVGEVAMAAILMGVVAGVISPVSWYHHLVWVPLAGAALVYRSRGVERVVGWVILVCSSIGIGVLGFVLRQGGGTDLPVMIGYVLLQLAAGGAVVSHGVRARRSPEREAQHVAG